MPRLIDAEERNAEIARAALRVLENEGMSALSVRNVAAEAGIAPASLRRAFPSQHSLREYCIELIEERATARITSIELTGRELVDEVLAQLLPLDGERRMEMIAQTQLGVLSMTDESLRPATARMNEGVERGCRYAIEVLIREGQFNSSRDSERETQRLHALLDGIAMQLLWSGTEESSQRALVMLGRHIDELASSAFTRFLQPGVAGEQCLGSAVV